VSIPSGGHVVVVGASLAGATVAATLREVGFEGEITLLGEETALPYERPALSKKYLEGTVSAAELLVHDEAFYAENQITLRLGERAVTLDGSLIRLDSGDLLEYQTLVIATGAANIRPPIPGIGLRGVHQLRTLADADALRADLAGAKTAVVVGMGFIGCEIAATLTGLGIAVTAVDGLPGPLWGPLGPELSAVVRGWHEQHGVRVLTDTSVTALVPDHSGTALAALELGSGERLEADVAVVGVGVRPNTAWLSGTPLRLVSGAVAVDGVGATNIAGVYAVGDVVATFDPASGRHVRREHWAAAIAQGRRAAHRIAGRPGEVDEIPYFWSDQYDKTLLYSGVHDGDDLLVVRGDLDHAASPVTGLFLRAGAVTAVVAVNDGKQFRRAQRLLGLTLNPTDLADLALDLRRLARPAPTSPG